ncbi:MAG: NADH-quinone oxidoreductase subunit L [Planctomycetes bacterium]|nr:NADH-quinone oxidoreductase subunit L [Planctomycetota bacterium]
MRASLLWLIPALPLIGAVVNGALALAGARSANGPARGFVSLVAVLLPAAAFALSVAALLALPAAGPGATAPALAHTLWEWMHLGGLSIALNVLVDPLTALMLLFVTGIGTLITLYSVGYMWADRGFARFMAYLNLFLASMIVLVMGGSLPVTFIGWEGVGLCSYLLIGFWHHNDEYNDAARKAFVMNRIGDLGFLLGAFALASVTGSLDYQQIAAFFRDGGNEGLIAAKAGVLALAGVLLFLGCTGKSAQVPLLTWLPDAMAGPTPVSALIHAATMVTAGVFLVGRLGDFYAHCPPWVLQIVLVTGAATAFFGAVAGLFQNDIKKALAYSTVSQLGFMFMAAGVGAFDVAIFHVFTHAFFKATLFLGAGAVIHRLHHEQDMRRMGGLKRDRGLFWTYLAMSYGWWAIIGLPGGAGFFSKDLILERLAAAGPVGVAACALALGTAGLTAVYMTRLMVLTFWGGSRVTDEARHHLQKVPVTMTIPLVILGFGSLLAGLVWMELPVAVLNSHLLPGFLAPVLAPAQQVATAAHGHGLHLPAVVVALLGTGLAAAGWVVAWLLWRKGPTGPSVEQRPTSVPGGFGGAWTFAFDRVYDLCVVKPVKGAALALYFLVELLLVAGLTEAVRMVATGVCGAGFALSQRSRLRTHLALGVLGLVAVVAVIAWAL